MLSDAQRVSTEEGCNAFAGAGKYFLFRQALQRSPKVRGRQVASIVEGPSFDFYADSTHFSSLGTTIEHVLLNISNRTCSSKRFRNSCEQRNNPHLCQGYLLGAFGRGNLQVKGDLEARLWERYKFQVGAIPEPLGNRQSSRCLVLAFARSIPPFPRIHQMGWRPYCDFWGARALRRLVGVAGQTSHLLDTQNLGGTSTLPVIGMAPASL